jgi:hypothetical protein
MMWRRRTTALLTGLLRSSPVQTGVTGKVDLGYIMQKDEQEEKGGCSQAPAQEKKAETKNKG